MTVSNRFDQYAMVLPDNKTGPKCVPDKIDFVANERTEVDLSQLVFNGWLDYISGVYIDNTDNTGHLLFECAGTNQKFWFPAFKAGYVPLFVPNDPKVFVTSSQNATVTFQWYNVPVFPLILDGPNAPAGSDVNIVEVGGNPVTTAVPVSFVVTPPTLTDYSLTLNGSDQTAITAGQASNYLLIQNPVGNADVKINIAGASAATNGFTLTAGGTYENDKGIANAVHVDGTNTQKLIIFAG